MTKPPRQADLDRLVRAAVKAGVAGWRVVVREMPDGTRETELVVSAEAQPVQDAPKW